MEQTTLQDKLRLIPSVDKLMADPNLAPLREMYSDEISETNGASRFGDLRKEVVKDTAAEADFASESLARGRRGSCSNGWGTNSCR